ncbi:carbohydrate sulfotransferase 2-like [Acanthaster planci]|uniref:Carbohydrate sulfotransferase 2-like n=1 Tax=Acanthaster planci TaxID=133434 RepID=A0A8B7YE35_ACAPL|nr:carbohydrate sulfotransferase 2-like [Acanthaster planci]
MGRNLRCVLFGLAVVGAVCLLVFTRGKGVLVKNVDVESREPSTGTTQDSNAPTGTDSQRVNSSNAGPKSCSCNHSSDSISPFGGSGAEDRRATGLPADPTGIDNGRSAVGSRVVLLTSMRTGSSFIGEIFGRNDDIFYLFEPGLALLTELHSQGALFLQPIYMDMLSAIFHCNTSSLNFYIKWLSRQYPLEVKKKVPRLFDLVCYKWPTGRTGLACRKIDADLFERKCREKRHIAVKSIRIWDIGMFQPLIQDGNVKLKVVHLVRDPRGMTASRVLAMNFVDSTMKQTRGGFIHG